MIRRHLVPHTGYHFPISLSFFITIVGIVACCCALTTRIAAQATERPEDEEVLRVSTNLIVFPARIRDRKGQRPNGLTENDLRLKDPDLVTNGLYFAPGVDRVAMIFAL